MSKAGIYKSEVKKARDSLSAQGKHPSVDAVRIALGNTGSKTTIHKYLKELESEKNSPDDVQTSISEALQNLVQQLAAQLQNEANLQIEAVRAEQQEQENAHAAVVTAVQRDLAQWQQQSNQFEAELQNEQAAHSQTEEKLQQETITRHTAEQQVRGLQERVAENEKHRQSLEEKHQHARDALEHYRQSVKEQREQDQRRYEQQIQQLQAELRIAQQTIIVKQEDMTRLNQENARLEAEQSYAQQALREEQERTRLHAARIEALQAIEQRYGILESQVAHRDAAMGELKQQIAAATSSSDTLMAQLQGAQVELAGAKATLVAQQEVVINLRAYLNSRKKKVVAARPR